MKDPLFMQTSDEAKAHLAAIITSSDDAIISKDLNGTILSWNPAAERIFGYTAEEAIGKHISIIIPPDRLSEEDMIIGKIRAGERLDHFEAVRRAKNGNLLDLYVTVSPIRNAAGTIVGASKVARDITAMKKAERESAYLSSIIETSDDAIISKDLDGIITSWNKSAERIFGYPAEEIVGKHISILIPQERISEEEGILTTLRNGKRIDHFETMRRHRNGHLIPVSLTVSPIRNTAGNIIGASKISRDISERIRAEENMRQANIRKDEFMANMSHELRTPMNAVIGLASLMMRMDDLPPKALKFVETLKISADNLMELINDLLDFSKIESNALELEQVEFDLAEQVERAVSVTNVKAQEKRLGLRVHFIPPLSRHYIGDPLRVHQVLMNLLSNAIKFTEKGTVDVEISGAPAADKRTLVTMRVRDTGIGIPKDKLETIFEKFTQADSSMTRRYGGSGLGLAITKALVEKMGGAISVNSKQGEGSVFTVTLSLGNTERLSSIERFSTESITAKQPNTGRNVLLVEDYEPNVMVASTMLDMLGYNFDVARNGLEALQKFVQSRYDVILMDVQMHELDGLEATRRIRRMETERGLARTPIVAMTAHVREQDKQKCFEAGMDDFIPKPFEPIDLSNKIGRYVNQEHNVAQFRPNGA